MSGYNLVGRAENVGPNTEFREKPSWEKLPEDLPPPALWHPGEVEEMIEAVHVVAAAATPAGDEYDVPDAETDMGVADITGEDA